MEFFVCPSGHKIPEWWRGPCLECDYPGLLVEMAAKVVLIDETKNEKAKV